MAKLVPLLFLLLATTAVPAQGLQLELYAQTGLEAKDLKTKSIGGFSGVFWDGSQLVAVSDDRGKWGSPRFYEIKLKLSAHKAELHVGKMHRVKEAPSEWVLDLEAVAPLKNGDLLFSTEGDLNKKPRAQPHIFVTSATGVFKEDLTVPDKFLPEPTGLQKKGIENNRGFEGLTIFGDERMFAMNESPLFTDQNPDDDLNSWLRLVEFHKTEGTFKTKAEYAYKVTRAGKNDLGIEVFRGVSEILALRKSQVIVLERGARLTKTGLVFTAGLYLAHLEKAADVSGVANISDGKTRALKKDKLVEFEEILQKEELENYEAMAWGPVLPEGRKSLLVLSDNNFSTKEKTRLLVFAVKEEP